MADPELVNTAKKYLQQGYSEEDMVQAFRNAGYNDSEIREIMAEALKVQSSFVAGSKQEEKDKREYVRNVFGTKTPRPSGLREEPEEEPVPGNKKKHSFDLDIIPYVFVKPKESFEKIKENTTWFEGSVLILLSQMVMALLAFLIIGWFAPTSSAEAMFAVFFNPMFVSIILGSIFLYVCMVSGVANFLGGNGNSSQTLGFFGYVYVANLLWMVLFGLMVFFPLGLYLVGIAHFFWSLYVVGHAVSVANDMPLFHALIDMFLVGIIYALVVSGLFFGLTLFVLPTFFQI